MKGYDNDKWINFLENYLIGREKRHYNDNDYNYDRVAKSDLNSTDAYFATKN